jgi:hypothetical protein
MFLNPRPQCKIGQPLAPDTCRSCARHVREGSAYCCLACKVSALEAGEVWAPAPNSPDASGNNMAVGRSPSATASSALNATVAQCRDTTPGSCSSQHAFTLTAQQIKQSPPASRMPVSVFETYMTSAAQVITAHLPDEGAQAPENAMPAPRAFNSATLALLTAAASATEQEVDQKATVAAGAAICQQGRGSVCHTAQAVLKRHTSTPMPSNKCVGPVRFAHLRVSA